MRRDTTKYVLKQAARGLLPDWAIDKRKIGFFRQASSGWLDAQLNIAIGEYLGADARVGAFLDPGAIRQAAHDGGTRTQFVLATLILEVWLREVVEGANETVALSGGAK